LHGAITDTEPDGWARRVILRDHAKRRQEAKRTGTDVENRPLNAFDSLLAVDGVSRVGALRFNARFAASFIKVGLANVCSHENGRPRPNARHGSKPVDHKERSRNLPTSHWQIAVVRMTPTPFGLGPWHGTQVARSF
jgi:hypothetical protein